MNNVNVSLCVVDGGVIGVAQLDNVVYIHVHCAAESLVIMRFNARTHERLTDITVEGLRQPRDIAACQQTSVIYVADAAFVWRVSSGGGDVRRWLPKSPSNMFKPDTLSVTSSRLLVTSRDTSRLRQFDAIGDELRQVDLPRDMHPHHAVELPAGTFVVSHYNRQLKQYQVSDVNIGGQVLRQFSGSRLLPLRLGDTPHMAVDSQGSIFVADFGNRRILLLNSELTLRRVIIDEHQLKDKHKLERMCYSQQSGHLLVVLQYGRVVVMFDVLRR